MNGLYGLNVMLITNNIARGLVEPQIQVHRYVKDLPRRQECVLRAKNGMVSILNVLKYTKV